MNRRGFLKALGLGAAAVAIVPELDLEKLLWVPGQKRIFLPTARPTLIVYGNDYWVRMIQREEEIRERLMPRIYETGYWERSTPINDAEDYADALRYALALRLGPNGA